MTGGGQGIVRTDWKRWLTTVGMAGAVLAAGSSPCAGAPEAPWLHGTAAAGHGTRPGGAQQADSAWPAFQVLGTNRELAIVDPLELLTTSVILRPDVTFTPLNVTGLAVDSAGTVYISGNDNNDSALGRIDFNTGLMTTVGKLPGYVINDIAFDGAGHLYGLTDNALGSSPHTLLLIDTATAAPTVVKVLDNHGGAQGFGRFGAITFNSTDGSGYYADLSSKAQLFLDKLAPGTFAQTPVLAPDGPSYLGAPAPEAMAFSQGKLWLFLSDSAVLSWDPSFSGEGWWKIGYPAFPSANGGSTFYAVGAVPNRLSCAPSTTAACLYNRFKVEVTFDAPGISGGSALVVLENATSVKFTFFYPASIEVILKILNACSFGQKWWVFAGGLTNLGVLIKVTDTANGAVRTYHSAKGHLFQTFADTAAFSCP
jgi:hypothetical protein